MPTTTMKERLADMGRQIDELEAMARSSTGEATARIQRQVDALRRQEGAARSAAEDGADSFDEKFEQFQARLRVARSAVAADLAENGQAFADAVEAELDTWDAYFERLQGQTALRAASARAQAEAAISDLRRSRNTVAERLADTRAASADRWDEQHNRISAARDDLERKAEELSAKFR